MAKNYKKDAQQLLDMADVNQFQRDIASYSADALMNLSKIFIAFKIENDREGYDLVLKEKISIIKETRLNKQKSETKTVKSISKVIAKVQEEVKQEAVAPQKQQKPRNSSLAGVSIKNSSDTPRNSGIKYNNQRGQGDFFGKSSAFKLIQQLQSNIESSSNDNQMGFDFDSKVKKTRKASTPTVVKSSITHLDAKALKQIKDILMLPEKLANKSSVKRSPRRQTKAEKDKAELRRDELSFKENHLKEMSRKHRSDGRIDRKKIKESVEANNSRTELQKRALEFREKAEANKLKKVELSNQLKEKLAQKHIEYSKLGIEKTRIKRQADKDKQEGRLQLQRQKKDQTNRNQMERHMHGIHPALGMMYGMNQNKKESEGGGSGDMMSSVLGGAAGGVGAAGFGVAIKKFAGNGLKLGGSRIPVIGGLITAYYKSLDEGIVKGVTSGAGVTVGGAVGATIGTAILPGLGTAIGAAVGAWFGEKGARLLHDLVVNGALKSSGLVEQIGASSGLMAGVPANPNVKKVPNNSIKAGNIPTGAPIDNFLDSISEYEGKTYNTKFGGEEVSGLTDMTLSEIVKYQANNDNFKKGADGKVISRALGKFQMNGNFMKDAVKNSGLDPNTTKFTPEIQKQLILRDLKHRGLDKYLSGEMSVEDFGNQGAGLLASLPLLKPEAGRGVGESRYSGIAGNKAHQSLGKYKGSLLDLKNSTMQKAPPKVSSLQDSTNRMQQKSMEEKSKPMNVVSVGGSTGGSSTNISNTYVNPMNTDSTIRQLANNMMFPARLV